MKGVDMMTFDSKLELHKVKRDFPSAKYNTTRIPFKFPSANSLLLCHDVPLKLLYRCVTVKFGNLVDLPKIAKFKTVKLKFFGGHSVIVVVATPETPT